MACPGGTAVRTRLPRRGWRPRAFCSNRHGTTSPRKYRKTSGSRRAASARAEPSQGCRDPTGGFQAAQRSASGTGPRLGQFPGSVQPEAGGRVPPWRRAPQAGPDARQTGRGRTLPGAGHRGGPTREQRRLHDHHPRLRRRERLFVSGRSHLSLPGTVRHHWQRRGLHPRVRDRARDRSPDPEPRHQVGRCELRGGEKTRRRHPESIPGADRSRLPERPGVRGRCLDLPADDRPARLYQAHLPGLPPQTPRLRRPPEVCERPQAARQRISPLREPLPGASRRA